VDLVTLCESSPHGSAGCLPYLANVDTYSGMLAFKESGVQIDFRSFASSLSQFHGFAAVDDADPLNATTTNTGFKQIAIFQNEYDICLKSAH
jgi:hypothetical protein